MNELTKARIVVLEAKIAKIKTQRHQIDHRMSADIEHARTRCEHWRSRHEDLVARAHKGGIRDDERVYKLQKQVDALRGEP